MAGSCCWLLAETFAGAVDRNTLFHMAAEFQEEPPDTYSHKHTKRERSDERLLDYSR